MPKMKRHSGAAKRFKVTGTGKLRRRKAGMTHYRELKSPQRRRRLQRDDDVHPSDIKRIRRLLGS